MITTKTDIYTNNGNLPLPLLITSVSDCTNLPLENLLVLTFTKKKSNYKLKNIKHVQIKKQYNPIP